MATVSIIIPVYRIIDYISKCVESVIAQSFHDIEIILVDDGSDDYCGKICDGYLWVDSRIFVIHQKNSGVSVARNNGVSLCSGEYISFVDGDDWISPCFTDRLFSECKKTDCQVAVCSIKNTYVYTNGVPPTKDSRVLEKNAAIDYLGLAMDARFRSPFGKLVKSSIINNNPFPVGRRFAEDMACVYKWIYASNKIVYIPEQHYYYYQRPDSAVHANFDWYRLDSYATFEEMLNFFEEKEFNIPYQCCLYKYLHEMMDGYEKCKDLQKNDICEAIQENLRKVLHERLGCTDNRLISRREDIIPILEKLNYNVAQRYISDCYYGLVSLYKQSKNRRIKRTIKKRLRILIEKYHSTPKQYPYVYELISPKKMKAYWLKESLIRKLKETIHDNQQN